jgi:hypothetical protein
MTKRMRVLLCLVVIALAVSPLRGTFGLPGVGAVDDADQCARMAQDMRAMDHGDPGRHTASPHHPDHHCKQGCGGDRCNGSCGTCIHAFPALPGATAAAPDAHSGFLVFALRHRYAERTISPPFRPPISLAG